jgi:hypothetical protein
VAEICCICKALQTPATPELSLVLRFGQRSAFSPMGLLQPVLQPG